MDLQGVHATGQEILSTPAAKRKSLEFHEKITDLIDSGDGVRAAEMMAEHIENNIRAVKPDHLDQRVDPTVIRLDW